MRIGEYADSVGNCGVCLVLEAQLGKRVIAVRVEARAHDEQLRRERGHLGNEDLVEQFEPADAVRPWCDGYIDRRTGSSGVATVRRVPRPRIPRELVE